MMSSVGTSHLPQRVLTKRSKGRKGKVMVNDGNFDSGVNWNSSRLCQCLSLNSAEYNE